MAQADMVTLQETLGKLTKHKEAHTLLKGVGCFLIGFRVWVLDDVWDCVSSRS
jgi:hypothetical protein